MTTNSTANSTANSTTSSTIGNSTSPASGADPASAATGERQNNIEANFSTLVLSIGSSAAMALGLAPNPVTGKSEKDKDLARFNIDLLRMLRDKTKGNLSADEQRFIESVVTDLQVKFVNG